MIRKWCRQKENMRDTEYKLRKTIIQNHFYGTYAVPSGWGGLVSTVHMLYCPSRGVNKRRNIQTYFVATRTDLIALKSLTWKSCFLVALASAKRISELHGLSFWDRHSGEWKLCIYSFIPEFVAKTQNLSILDNRFEEIVDHSLHDFIDGARTFRPRTVGPRTVGPQTVGPTTVGPRTVGRRTFRPPTVGSRGERERERENIKKMIENSDIFLHGLSYLKTYFIKFYFIQFYLFYSFC